MGLRFKRGQLAGKRHRAIARWIGLSLGVALGVVQMSALPGWSLVGSGRDSLAIGLEQFLNTPTERTETTTPADLLPTWPDELDSFLPPTPLNPVDRQVVRFDGQNLFEVGVVVSTGAKVEPVFTAAERVRQIRTQLYDIARSSYDPATLSVTVAPDPETSPAQIISVNGRYLMTVNSVDAQIAGAGTDVAAHAATLRDIIATALMRYQQQRTPWAVLQQGAIALGVVGLISAVVWGLDRWQRRLLRSRYTLRQTLQRLKADATTALEPNAPVGDTTLRQQLITKRQSTAIEVAIPLLWALQILLVGVGIYTILGVIPYTRWAQPILLAVMPVPLKLLGLAWGALVGVRVGSNLVNRAILALEDRMISSPATSQRTALRFSTFASVMVGVLSFIIWGSAILIGFSVVGIQIAPLLAGAGIVGLAISFASQSLIKDIINGFFILLEDQYGVGDVVVIGDVSGFVEEMNLRMTQLRNEEGRLITIPNNTITVVQNLSKEWSRVDLMIDVAAHSDLDAAIALIKDVAEGMTRELYWRNLILEPPSLLGVDRLDYRGATVRMWIKTQPLKQWEVAREYRRRLKLAFDAAGIEIGIPQQKISLQAAEVISQPPPSTPESDATPEPPEDVS